MVWHLEWECNDLVKGDRVVVILMDLVAVLKYFSCPVDQNGCREVLHCLCIHSVFGYRSCVTSLVLYCIARL